MEICFVYFQSLRSCLVISGYPPNTNTLIYQSKQNPTNNESDLFAVLSDLPIIVYVLFCICPSQFSQRMTQVWWTQHLGFIFTFIIACSQRVRCRLVTSNGKHEKSKIKVRRPNNFSVDVCIVVVQSTKEEKFA